MADILGTTINTPTINLTGFLSNSWIYVLIIGFIGFILVAGLAIILFTFTWNRKIELYENISGRGYVRTRKVLARRIKLSRDGAEVLRTVNGDIFSAYGRKIARNTFAFAKGEDGYWYNFVFGDLDAKFGTLDIEPVDKDVRMFHIGIDKIAEKDYGDKKGFIEKYGIHMVMVVLVIGILVGFYIISGQIAEGLRASNNPQVAEQNKETAEILNNLANKLDVIIRNSGRLQEGETIPEGGSGQGGSGLVPANNLTGGG